MGDINRVLAEGRVEPRSITPRGIWADLCENVHLHLRNLRLDMSIEEWSRLRAAMNHLGLAVEWGIEEYEYEEGDPNFLVHLAYDFPYQSPDSDYYKDRTLIEMQRDGSVHVHYRDIRIHLTPAEFRGMVDLFRQAWDTYTEVQEGSYDLPDWARGAKKIERGTVPITCVQPYDDGHRAGAIDQEHRAGIEYAKSLLKDGKRLRPIYIAPNGQRLDGFKRYMAAHELGYETIEVIVDPFWQKDGLARSGQQHGQSMLADGEETNASQGKEDGRQVSGEHPPRGESQGHDEEESGGPAEATERDRSRVQTG